MENATLVKCIRLGGYTPRPRYRLTIKDRDREVDSEGYLFGDFPNGTALFHLYSARPPEAGWVLIVKETREVLYSTWPAEPFHITEVPR